MTHFGISNDTGVDELDALLMRDENPADKFDLLQQAIIAGNQTAVAYLLMKNYKPSSYHPDCNEYLHLACKLNRHVMVKTIIEVGHNVAR